MEIYAETYNQSEPIFVSKENCIKEGSLLIHTDELSLESGQTALFYTKDLTQNGETSKATSWIKCGYGSNFNNLTNIGISVIGNRVIMSVVGKEDAVLPTADRDMWETWYDEKAFIYYHFLNIE